MMAGLLSRMRTWLDDVRRYDTFRYGRFTFHLPKDKCDNLRRSTGLAASFQQAYLAKWGKGRTRAAGFQRDVQNANLMVLREFDRVCKARGFVYMLYSGTLLGAYRHGGFIPWDDDIDVIMPREHYERIIDVFNAESANPSLRAKLVSPSRGSAFIKIEAVGEPLVFIDVLSCDCYAGTPDKPLAQCQKDLFEQCVNKVLPDKNPAAAYAYLDAFRNNLGLGLTPVAHDDPACSVVVCSLHYRGGHFFDAATVFPPARADFEGMSVPVPADSAAMIGIRFGKNYAAFPMHIRSHFQSRKLTIAGMLNVKRFLRSDPLHPPRTPVPGRADATECWRDRLVTLIRKAASPVFNVITRDTLKEYRFFSKTILFRLRTDRVIRGYLEAIESYSRLVQDKSPFPEAQGEMRRRQLAGADVLARVLRVCESAGLTVWLWSGSLLGAIRDGAFLHTDSSVFLLMPRTDYERLRPLVNVPPAPADAGTDNQLQAKLFAWKGGVATFVNGVNGGVAGSGVIVIPCDSCPDDWDRNEYAKHVANAAGKAERAELTAKKDVEGLYKHFAAARERMGIGLESDKSHSLFPAWDCPDLFGQSHVLLAKYYAPSATRMFEGLEVPVPADSDMVLTSLYGDWLYYV